MIVPQPVAAVRLNELLGPSGSAEANALGQITDAPDEGKGKVEERHLFCGWDGTVLTKPLKPAEQKTLVTTKVAEQKKYREEQKEQSASKRVRLEG